MYILNYMHFSIFDPFFFVQEVESSEDPTADVASKPAGSENKDIPTEPSDPIAVVPEPTQSEGTLVEPAETVVEATAEPTETAEALMEPTATLPEQKESGAEIAGETLNKAKETSKVEEVNDPVDDKNTTNNGKPYILQM